MVLNLRESKVSNKEPFSLKLTSEWMPTARIAPAQQPTTTFFIEPLGEFLAAINLIDTYGRNNALWEKFLRRLDSLAKSDLQSLATAYSGALFEVARYQPIEYLQRLFRN